MSDPFKGKSEVKIDEFLGEVHIDLWEEDTMHEYRINEDGSVDIIETIHSMNSDFSRTVVTVGSDGFVKSTGESKSAKYCKEKRIKIVV